MRGFFKVLGVIAIGLLLANCRPAPIYNVQSSELGVRSGATTDQVATAIKRAAAGLNWTIRDQQPGLMIATINVRTHSATVEIRYDTRTFSIAYRDSANLNYTGSQIHQNYSNWVQNLERAIRREALAI